MVRYTINGEMPTCRSGEKWTPDSKDLALCGAPQGRNTTVRAVGCHHGPGETNWTASPPSERVFNIVEYSPPQPSAPSISLDPSMGCTGESPAVCPLDIQQVLLTVVPVDKACSDPAFVTEEECVEEGGEWRVLPRCSGRQGEERPCIEIFVTVDETNPLDPNQERRYPVPPDGRLDPIEASTIFNINYHDGPHLIKAAAQRVRRTKDARCPCCCRGNECKVASNISSFGITLAAAKTPSPWELDPTTTTTPEAETPAPAPTPSPPAELVIRDPAIGSPTITFTFPHTGTLSHLKGSIGTYNKDWRADVAQALSLNSPWAPEVGNPHPPPFPLNPPHFLPPTSRTPHPATCSLQPEAFGALFPVAQEAYLRIRGDCDCSLQGGDTPCEPSEFGERICFRREGDSTLVSFFITTVGSCESELASDSLQCGDDSNCFGALKCKLSPYTWQLAWGDLQDMQAGGGKSTQRALKDMGVTAVDLQGGYINVDAAREFARGGAKSWWDGEGPAAVAAAAFVSIAAAIGCFCCFRSRKARGKAARWWRRCWGGACCCCFGSGASRNMSMRQFREQERLARHAQFQRFVENGRGGMMVCSESSLHPLSLCIHQYLYIYIYFTTSLSISLNLTVYLHCPLPSPLSFTPILKDSFRIHPKSSTRSPRPYSLNTRPPAIHTTLGLLWRGVPSYGT
jgi:hypothetical protein